jgi:hypothetical protein
MSELETPAVLDRLAALSWVVLRLTLCAYALWLLGACFLQRRVLFPSYAVAAPLRGGFALPGGEQGWLETPAGPVEWWFFPHPAASPEHPAPLVVYAHGNAELIQDQAPEVARYRELGFHVLLCEYRGYGNSRGSPTQSGIVRDHVLVLNQVLVREDLDRERLLFHGRSLGTGVVCALALERAPRALVLTAPCSSVRDLMAAYGIPGFLCFDPFDNVAALESLGLPTLILHGAEDRTIPVSHARRIAERCPGVQLELLPSVGHNDFPADSPRVRERVERFLRESGFQRPP